MWIRGIKTRTLIMVPATLALWVLTGLYWNVAGSYLYNKLEGTENLQLVLVAFPCVLAVLWVIRHRLQLAREVPAGLNHYLQGQVPFAAESGVSSGGCPASGGLNVFQPHGVLGQEATTTPDSAPSLSEGRDTQQQSINMAEEIELNVREDQTNQLQSDDLEAGSNSEMSPPGYAGALQSINVPAGSGMGQYHNGLTWNFRRMFPIRRPLLPYLVSLPF